MNMEIFKNEEMKNENEKIHIHTEREAHTHSLTYISRHVSCNNVLRSKTKKNPVNNSFFMYKLTQHNIASK